MKYFQTRYLASLFLAALPLLASAQQLPRCGYTCAMKHGERVQPGYMDAEEKAFQAAKLRGAAANKTNTVYTIPVVVHVVYYDDSQNLPDSVIFDQIRVLNEDYRHRNADSVNLRTDFEPLVGDAHVEFVLANVDPAGNYTTGITRTQSTVNGFLDFLGFFTGDLSSTERVKSTADGGIDPWDQNHYLNIWVCDLSANILGQVQSLGLLGYASPPPNLPGWPAGSTDGLSDGVVIQLEAFGSNNPMIFGDGSTIFKGRTPTHEVGHYLGLRHIWGDGDCTEDDGIADTPDADDSSPNDCDPTRNTCTDPVLTYGDLPDMIENYMDYSAEACQNAFTKQQVELMRGVLEPGGFRNDLVTWYVPTRTDAALQPSMEVFPNPAQNQIAVRLSNLAGNDAQLSLFDATGRRLGAPIALGNVHSHELDLTGIAAGMYLLQVSSGTSTLTKRIVVAK